MSVGLKKQSNPFSTGGGGVNFETRVQASFAIALFTQSCVPCLSQNMRAKELKFQNKYDGSNTDDFVLVASDKSGNTSKLYAQIKHEITISESTGSKENSSTFTDVIKSAWEDFKSNVFDGKHDAIALITGSLAKIDVADTLPILEWAKYSANAEEFIKKSKTTGFTSTAKIKKLEVFRSQLEHANNGRAITDEELWKFLKVFYLVSFDLDSPHSVIAHLLCSLLQLYSQENPSLVLARIITCVQEFNQSAGTLTFENTPIDIKELFQNKSKIDFDIDFLKFQERGAYILEGISNTIQGYHVNRDENLAKISEAYDRSDFVFVTGARGTGKSGIVKDFILSKGRDIPIFYLRAEDLDRSHLNDVFSSFGMNSTLSEIEGYFSLLSKKVLVIESIEKVLELNHREAFNDLLQFIRKQSGWTIIATGRDYAFQQLCFTFLQQNLINFSSVNIDGFTKEQVTQVCEHITELQKLVKNEALEDILQIPFFIGIAVRAIMNGAIFQTSDTEIDFRKTVWSSVIANDQDRKFGMQIKRRKLFIEIAVQRAKKMVFGISVDEFDPEVINKLEEDSLIYRNERSSTVSLVHDVLEDWALEEFIEEQYQRNLSTLSSFLSAIGNEPAISRAFRLWLYRRLQFDDSIYEFIENLLNAEDIESFWKDETIAAILQYENPEKILNLMKINLLKEDCALLIRFCFILRITCQRPNSNLTDLLKIDKKSGILQTVFLKPYGKGWSALFNFIYENKEDLTKSTFNHLIELIHEWCGIININDDFPKESRIVGLLALWLLEPLKDIYRNQDRREKILSTLLNVSPTIKPEFDQLMAQDIFITKTNPQRLSYVDQITSMAFVGIHVPILCKYLPDFIIKLAMHEWFLEEIENDDWYRHRGIGTEESFGLDEEREFFPASGSKGPFQYLLNYHPRKALDFIIDLCNLTAQKYAQSKLASKDEEDFISDEFTVKKIELNLKDGSLIIQYSSSFLWQGYRGQSTLPYLLQCALMALENWLIDLVNEWGEESLIDWIYDYLLKNSNSVMITSILASAAVGFPYKVKKAAFPILNAAELYFLDLTRTVHEMGENQPHWFGYNNDVMNKIYIQERSKASLRPWRKESLETLLMKLQFDSELRGEALEIVDNLKDKAAIGNEISLKYLVNRVDTRTWEAIDDQENNRIIFQNKAELPEDLKLDQQKINEEHDANNFIISLNLWARKLFEEKQFKAEYFSSYKEGLKAAKQLWVDLQNKKTYDFSERTLGTITTVAAVCIRDDFDNLDSASIEWCFNIILKSVVMYADVIDGTSRYDKTDNWGSGACAYVLSKLFALNLESEQIALLKHALATALTHANLNVSALAAKGVRDFLWSIDSRVASNCLNGIVEYAKFQKEESESRKLYYLQGNELELARKKWRKMIFSFRNKLINGDFTLSVDHITLETHSGWFIHLPILMIPINPMSSQQIDLFKKIVNFIFESDYENYHSDDERKINHDIQKYIKDSLIEQIIHTKDNNFIPFRELLISGCLKAPSFIYSVKLSFDVKMEKDDDFDAIWSLWKILEPELHKIALIEVNEQYRRRQDINRLLRGELYVDTNWQDHESERKLMEHGTQYLLAFANQAANNSHVFEALCSLIYNFYDLFFERGIQILADKFFKDPKLIKKQVNTAFYLEMSIGRYLQVENRRMLSRKMYQTCLLLLTGIIETGSARAYYLREHLVRSRKITN